MAAALRPRQSSEPLASLSDMAGSTPSDASLQQMTLDGLAHRLNQRMLMHEALSVAVVAVSMFLIWSGPGSAWGGVFVVLIGLIVAARLWRLPGSLEPVPTDTATDPEAAARQLTALANRTMTHLQVPTVAGFVMSLLAGGWQPAMFGSLVTIAGFTFFGPSRTRLATWRDRLESAGGKTGL